MIAHVDADCFFASVELKSRPHLKDKPVLVVSRMDNRGIVLSANYTARALAARITGAGSVKAGTPLFKIRGKLPGAVLIKSTFEKYEKESGKLMNILRGFSPVVEVYSIDEAFVSLSGLRMMYRADYAGIAAKIQRQVEKELGITVSIGLSVNKVLAKIASDFNKPAGLTVVNSRDLKEFLKKIPIKDVPGIGLNTNALLEKFGIYNAYDFAVRNIEAIKKLLGLRGEKLHNALNGEPEPPFNMPERPHKSISHTRTFPDFSANKEYIFSFSIKLLNGLAMRLRSEGMEAGEIGFFLITKDFKILKAVRRLSAHCRETNVLINIYKELFAALFRQGTLYRKTGFFLTSLRRAGPRQGTLWEDKDTSAVDLAFDSIYTKFGSNAIMRGSMFKPRYTRRF